MNNCILVLICAMTNCFEIFVYFEFCLDMDKSYIPFCAPVMWCRWGHALQYLNEHGFIEVSFFYSTVNLVYCKILNGF